MSLRILPPTQTALGSLAQSLGMGLSQGIQSQVEDFYREKKALETEERFREQGFPEDLAKLAAIATTGGQTEILKKVLEERERGPLDRSLTSESFTEEEEPLSRGLTFSPQGLTVKEQATRQQQFEKRAFERNKKYLDRISDISAELPKEKVALAQMEGALQSGDFNSWRNAFAEIIGQDVLKTASAQTVNSAAKQFLMSSLAGLTGRPNQFIERQITRALINPVYQDEANQLIYEGIKGLADLKEEEVNAALELEEKFIGKGKEVPRNFQKLVRDRIQKEANAFEKRYEERVKNLLSQEKKFQLMVAPDGKKFRVPLEKVKEAQKAGYKVSR